MLPNTAYTRFHVFSLVSLLHRSRSLIVLLLGWRYLEISNGIDKILPSRDHVSHTPIHPDRDSRAQARYTLQSQGTQAAIPAMHSQSISASASTVGGVHPMPLTCPMCEFRLVFAGRAPLEEHLCAVHFKSVRPYWCQACGEHTVRFATKRQVKEHVATAHPSRAVKVGCWRWWGVACS